MCGIVGLLAKTPAIAEQLGALLVPMLEGMSERGPDSAGFAVFGRGSNPESWRVNLLAPRADYDWSALVAALPAAGAEPGSRLESEGLHAIVELQAQPEEFLAILGERFPELAVLSLGRCMDVFKDTGAPSRVASRYRLGERRGSHAIGHTRMATESGITPLHAHPFVAGPDFCIVHNGSLSNPYMIRRAMERRGIRFHSDNDTEAAARYIQWRLAEGDDLEDALRRALQELDGFFTLLMGNAEGMALLRDPFACKPAVVAETDDYVAVASEFRSLKQLPGVNQADIFEPQPEEVYSWKV